MTVKSLLDSNRQYFSGVSAGVNWIQGTDIVKNTLTWTERIRTGCRSLNTLDIGHIVTIDYMAGETTKVVATDRVKGITILFSTAGGKIYPFVRFLFVVTLPFTPAYRRQAKK